MSKDTTPMTDAELGRVLQNFDLVGRPSRAFLEALEADILEQVEVLPQDSAAGLVMPAWIPQQVRTPRAAAMASVLIVVLGFLIGQVSFTRGGAQYAAVGISVMALADDASTDATWGDSDDDTE